MGTRGGRLSVFSSGPVRLRSVNNRYVFAKDHGGTCCQLRQMFRPTVLRRVVGTRTPLAAHYWLELISRLLGSFLDRCSYLVQSHFLICTPSPYPGPLSSAAKLASFAGRTWDYLDKTGYRMGCRSSIGDKKILSALIIFHVRIITALIRERQVAM